MRGDIQALDIGEDASSHEEIIARFLMDISTALSQSDPEMHAVFISFVRLASQDTEFATAFFEAIMEALEDAIRGGGNEN